MNESPYSHYPPPPGYPPSQPPQPNPKRRSKFLAGFFAFFVPGTGHMYAGAMVKGIVIMMLLALNICGIVFTVSQGGNVLSIVLLSLMIPVIYFYSLFDAVQSAEAVNERPAGAPGWPGANGWHGNPPQETAGDAKSLPPNSILLLAAAGVAILLLADINWSHWAVKSSGTLFGALVLIGVGTFFWLWESKGRAGRK